MPVGLHVGFLVNNYPIHNEPDGRLASESVTRRKTDVDRGCSLKAATTRVYGRNLHQSGECAQDGIPLPMLTHFRRGG